MEQTRHIVESVFLLKSLYNFKYLCYNILIKYVIGLERRKIYEMPPL